MYIVILIKMSNTYLIKKTKTPQPDFFRKQHYIDLRCKKFECDEIVIKEGINIKVVKCGICDYKSHGFKWQDRRFCENEDDEGSPRAICLNCIFDVSLEQKAKSMWQEDSKKQ